MPFQVSWPVVGAVVHPNIGGFLGGYFVKKNMPWYESLNKPSWRPPNWAFGPVWTTLYSSMGYASYLVWRDGGGFKEAMLPLSLYSANLALNWAWTPIFFGTHNIKLALYDLLLLLVNTVGMGILFYKVNRLAGYLILPYLAWGSFAFALNYSIYKNNPPAIEDKKS